MELPGGVRPARFPVLLDGEVVPVTRELTKARNSGIRRGQVRNLLDGWFELCEEFVDKAMLPGEQPVVGRQWETRERDFEMWLADHPDLLLGEPLELDWQQWRPPDGGGIADLVARRPAHCEGGKLDGIGYVLIENKAVETTVDAIAQVDWYRTAAEQHLSERVLPVVAAPDLGDSSEEHADRRAVVTRTCGELASSTGSGELGGNDEPTAEILRPLRRG